MHTRRQFVTRAGSAAAGLVLAPQALAAGLTTARRAPLVRGGSFPDGVISGDPFPHGVNLWTRLDDFVTAGSVDLEVATDAHFRHVVARERIGTTRAMNGSVKAKVRGLRPHEEYFYRFATATKDSAVGRFRTALPADSHETVRFAFLSCQDYTHGFYNAHALLADEDIDFVVNLGDYIYAETYHQRSDGTAVRDDTIGSVNPGNPAIVREALTLADYRAKYALYRSDPLLRRVHARFPMVNLWDDHEVQDNYAGRPADGGLPPANRYSPARRAAAYRAFFESQPVYEADRRQIYRSLRFGRTVEIVVMDQRRYRDNQPCDDAVAPPCADWDQPRAFLGATQMGWVKQQLTRSPATWKVLANEVTIMPTKVLGGAYFTYDSWQGYPREREELLQHIRSHRIRDVVFLTGDIHTFIAGDVRTKMGDGDTVAVEFVGGSITSQGLGETDIPAGNGGVIKGNDADPHTDPGIIDALRSINPWVDQADFDHHGYGVVKASSTAFDVKMRRLKTIKQRSTARLPDDQWHYHLARGQRSIKGVHGPKA